MTASNWWTRARRALVSEHLVWVLCLLLLLVAAPSTPGLLTRDSVLQATSRLAPLFVVALGQMLVLLLGGIDLSVTAVIAIASVTGGLVANAESGWLRDNALAVPAGLAAMLAAGAATGLCNGVAVTRGRVPAFMVTLLTMMTLSGLTIWMTRSHEILDLPPALLALGRDFWPGLLSAIALGAAVHVLLEYTLFGRWLRACGHQADAARVAGVPVQAVTVAAYVLCGLLAASASVLSTAPLESSSPVLGDRMLLDVIGAAVIGGTSLFGGRGRVVGTLGGAVFLTLLDTVLDLRGLPHFAIMMIKAAVIFLALIRDSRRRTSPASRKARDRGVGRGDRAHG